MKTIKLFLILILSVSLISCAKQDNKYSNIAEALDNGEYDKAVDIINALRIEADADNYHGQKIEITKDNYSDFFDLTYVDCWNYDNNGELRWIENKLALVAKPEYKDDIVKNGSKLTFDISWKQTLHDIEIDLNNQSYVIKDVREDDYFNTDMSDSFSFLIGVGEESLLDYEKEGVLSTTRFRNNLYCLSNENQISDGYKGEDLNYYIAISEELSVNDVSGVIYLLPGVEYNQLVNN